MKRLFSALVLTCSLFCCLPAQAASDLDLGPVGDFALTESNGGIVRNTDLRGKVWIASFVFTRCTSGCPQVTETMQALQKDLARYPDLRLVTFTVDPEHDNPDELKRYAEHYGADPQRWLFLTGTEQEMYRLLGKGFHITALQNQGKERTPGNEVTHDTKLVLVDRNGHIRGYHDRDGHLHGAFDGMISKPLPGETDEDSRKRFEDGLRQLRLHVAVLEREGSFDFPAFNATLNALAGALILLGFYAVRRRRLKLHAALMLSALGVSAIFLTSYLYYHIIVRQGKETHFQDQAPWAPPWVRYLYYGILWSHIFLAVNTIVMAPLTAYWGVRGRLEKHVRLARWTLPIWLYVSVTGVVVYWMLYRLYAP